MGTLGMLHKLGILIWAKDSSSAGSSRNCQTLGIQGASQKEIDKLLSGENAAW